MTPFHRASRRFESCSAYNNSDDIPDRWPAWAAKVGQKQFVRCNLFAACLGRLIPPYSALALIHYRHYRRFFATRFIFAFRHAQAAYRPRSPDRHNESPLPRSTKVIGAPLAQFPDIEGRLCTLRQVDGAHSVLLFGTLEESKAEGVEELSRISL